MLKMSIEEAASTRQNHVNKYLLHEITQQPPVQKGIETKFWVSRDNDNYDDDGKNRLNRRKWTKKCRKMKIALRKVLKNVKNKRKHVCSTCSWSLANRFNVDSISASVRITKETAPFLLNENKKFIYVSKVLSRSVQSSLISSWWHFFILFFSVVPWMHFSVFL